MSASLKTNFLDARQAYCDELKSNMLNTESFDKLSEYIEVKYGISQSLFNISFANDYDDDCPADHPDGIYYKCDGSCTALIDHFSKEIVPEILEMIGALVCEGFEVYEDYAGSNFHGFRFR
jgi:hypothetical protein